MTVTDCFLVSPTFHVSVVVLTFALGFATSLSRVTTTVLSDAAGFVLTVTVDVAALVVSRVTVTGKTSIGFKHTGSGPPIAVREIAVPVLVMPVSSSREPPMLRISKGHRTPGGRDRQGPGAEPELTWQRRVRGGDHG